jgi:7-cyano-7-deazaguanine synthase
VRAKAILASSGGLDSGVLLHSLLLNRYEVLAVQFQYGGKHNHWELNAQVALTAYLRGAKHLPVATLSVDLTKVFSAFRSDLLKTGGDLPTGHYQEENMRRTVVPGRNLIFASVLAGLAESNDIPQVFLGVHAGDHFIYPDCRPAFVNNLYTTVLASSDGKVGVLAPYLSLPKSEIVKVGLENEFPFELTRTCYADQETACGKCGSCQERLEAFHLNGVPDPLDYESRELLPKSH